MNGVHLVTQEKKRVKTDRKWAECTECTAQGQPRRPGRAPSAQAMPRPAPFPIAIQLVYCDTLLPSSQPAIQFFFIFLFLYCNTLNSLSNTSPCQNCCNTILILQYKFFFSFSQNNLGSSPIQKFFFMIIIIIIFHYFQQLEKSLKSFFFHTL